MPNEPVAAPDKYGPHNARQLPGTGADHPAETVHVWRDADGGLVIQNAECDILVPPHGLRALAEFALAVHVHNGRPDAKGKTP